MLEQIKQAVDEWDTLDIETRALLFRSNALHKQLDKLRMDLYTFHHKLDVSLVDGMSDDEWVDLSENIRKTTITVRTTEEMYYEIRKEYSNTWPKTVKAEKKVDKLKKKFWEQEGLTL